MTLAVCLVLLLSAPASPADSSRLYEEAVRQLEDLEYDRAAALLQEVIVARDADEALQKAARVELAQVEVIRGRLSEAKLHYVWVLKRDPHHTLDDRVSPKVRRYLQTVKDEHLAAAPPARAPAEPVPATEPESETEGASPTLLAVGGGAAAFAVVVVGAAVGAAAAIWYVRAQPSLGVYDQRTD